MHTQHARKCTFNIEIFPLTRVYCLGQGEVSNRLGRHNGDGDHWLTPASRVTNCPGDPGISERREKKGKASLLWNSNKVRGSWWFKFEIVSPPWVRVGMEMIHVTAWQQLRAGPPRLLITTSPLWLSLNEIRLQAARRSSRYKARLRPGEVSSSGETDARLATCTPSWHVEIRSGLFSVNDPLIFAEGFYITSEGTPRGEQLAALREEFSFQIKS